MLYECVSHSGFVFCIFGAYICVSVISRGCMLTTGVEPLVCFVGKRTSACVGSRGVCFERVLDTCVVVFCTSACVCRVVYGLVVRPVV
jgi:hypothetical protein